MTTITKETEGLVLKDLYDEDEFVDVTDDVESYENGKTFQCECGQWFGVDFDTTMLTCPSCGKKVIDLDWEDRSPPERHKDQSAITEWGGGS